MRDNLVVAALLVAVVSFFFLRPILRLVRISARLAVWLVLLGVVVTATLLLTQRPEEASPTTPTYQSREPSFPYR